MTSEEFLNIYNLFLNIHNRSDYIFLINVIKTCKTYRHYKTNTIRFRDIDGFLVDQCGHVTLETYMLLIENYPDRPVYKYKDNLQPIIEWLYSHTVHTSSLNSVSFK